nr:complement decay-accelerating factor-like isoform X3 [Pogona vitticeps]
MPRLIMSDCGPPPKLKNAVPIDGSLTESFRPLQSVIYKCLEGFYNIDGKVDVTTCLSDSTWSPIEEFCDPRCRKPKSSKFAELKGGERKHFYRIGTTLTYICRPGYNSIPGISQLITCLESRTWSALPVFCERKSCGHPGKPKYGDVVILTDLLYTAKVTFTCEKGYKLIGSPSTKCVLKGDRVEWEAKLPQCQRSTEGTTEETVKKKPGVKNIAAIIVGLSLGALILAIVIILALFFLLKHLR